MPFGPLGGHRLSIRCLDQSRLAAPTGDSWRLPGARRQVLLVGGPCRGRTRLGDLSCTGYVAVEGSTSPTSGAIGILRSRDGRTWRRVTLPGVSAFAFQPAVAAGRTARLGRSGMTCVSTGRAMRCWTSATVGACWRQAHGAGPTGLRPQGFLFPDFVGEYQRLAALRGQPLSGAGSPPSSPWRCRRPATGPTASSPGPGRAGRHAHRRRPSRATPRCRRCAGCNWIARRPLTGRFGAELG